MKDDKHTIPATLYGRVPSTARMWTFPRPPNSARCRTTPGALGP